jgi:hypothetical protein
LEQLEGIGPSSMFRPAAQGAVPGGGSYDRLVNEAFGQPMQVANAQGVPTTGTPPQTQQIAAQAASTAQGVPTSPLMPTYNTQGDSIMAGWETQQSGEGEEDQDDEERDRDEDDREESQPGSGMKQSDLERILATEYGYMTEEYNQPSENVFEGWDKSDVIEELIKRGWEAPEQEETDEEDRPRTQPQTQYQAPRVFTNSQATLGVPKGTISGAREIPSAARNYQSITPPQGGNWTALGTFPTGDIQPGATTGGGGAPQGPFSDIPGLGMWNAGRTREGDAVAWFGGPGITDGFYDKGGRLIRAADEDDLLEMGVSRREIDAIKAGNLPNVFGRTLPENVEGQYFKGDEHWRAYWGTPTQGARQGQLPATPPAGSQRTVMYDMSSGDRDDWQQRTMDIAGLEISPNAYIGQAPIATLAQGSQNDANQRALDWSGINVARNPDSVAFGTESTYASRARFSPQQLAQAPAFGAPVPIAGANGAPVVSAGTQLGSTTLGTSQQAANTAQTATPSAGGLSQYDQDQLFLKQFQDIFAKGPQKLAPGALERLLPTEQALMASALNASGINPEDWLTQYDRTAVKNEESALKL